MPEAPGNGGDSVEVRLDGEHLHVDARPARLVSMLRGGGGGAPVVTAQREGGDSLTRLVPPAARQVTFLVAGPLSVEATPGSDFVALAEEGGRQVVVAFNGEVTVLPAGGDGDRFALGAHEALLVPAGGGEPRVVPVDDLSDEDQDEISAVMERAALADVKPSSGAAGGTSSVDEPTQAMDVVVDGDGAAASGGDKAAAGAGAGAGAAAGDKAGATAGGGKAAAASGDKAAAGGAAAGGDKAATAAGGAAAAGNTAAAGGAAAAGDKAAASGDKAAASGDKAAGGAAAGGAAAGGAAAGDKTAAAGGAAAAGDKTVASGDKTAAAGGAAAGDKAAAGGKTGAAAGGAGAGKTGAAASGDKAAAGAKSAAGGTGGSDNAGDSGAAATGDKASTGGAAGGAAAAAAKKAGAQKRSGNQQKKGKKGRPQPQPGAKKQAPLVPAATTAGAGVRKATPQTPPTPVKKSSAPAKKATSGKAVATKQHDDDSYEDTPADRRFIVGALVAAGLFAIVLAVFVLTNGDDPDESNIAADATTTTTAEPDETSTSTTEAPAASTTTGQAAAATTSTTAAPSTTTTAAPTTTTTAPPTTTTTARATTTTTAAAPAPAAVKYGIEPKSCVQNANNSITYTATITNQSTAAFDYTIRVVFRDQSNASVATSDANVSKLAAGRSVDFTATGTPSRSLVGSGNCNVEKVDAKPST